MENITNTLTKLSGLLVVLALCGCEGNVMVDTFGPPEDDLKFKEIQAGYGYTCGITDDEQAYCWGAGYTSDGTFVAEEVSHISAGFYSACGIDEQDMALCWGNSTWHELPNIQINEISVGKMELCALSTDGGVGCFGDMAGNSSIPSINGFSEISVGTSPHACALNQNSEIVCWGSNQHGETEPPAGKYTNLESGDHVSCGELEGGGIVCWGWDTFGTLNVPDLEFMKYKIGELAGCGIKEDGQMICWGKFNGHEENLLLDGVYKDIAVGAYHICGIREDDTVTCVGSEPYDA